MDALDAEVRARIVAAAELLTGERHEVTFKRRGAYLYASCGPLAGETGQRTEADAERELQCAVWPALSARVAALEALCTKRDDAERSLVSADHGVRYAREALARAEGTRAERAAALDRARAGLAAALYGAPGQERAIYAALHRYDAGTAPADETTETT